MAIPQETSCDAHKDGVVIDKQEGDGHSHGLQGHRITAFAIGNIGAQERVKVLYSMRRCQAGL
jgi:hypothetical protein